MYKGVPVRYMLSRHVPNMYQLLILRKLRYMLWYNLGTCSSNMYLSKSHLFIGILYVFRYKVHVFANVGKKTNNFLKITGSEMVIIF